MAQGGGNASWSAWDVVALMVVSMLVLQADYVQARTYIVGDSLKWAFNVVDWPEDKHFNTGDVLVFKYNPSFHNVVVVDSGGYNNCQAPAGAKTYTSGLDRLTLSKGQNFFICSFPGHCANNMKIAVTAV